MMEVARKLDGQPPAQQEALGERPGAAPAAVPPAADPNSELRRWLDEHLDDLRRLLRLYERGQHQELLEQLLASPDALSQEALVLRDEVVRMLLPNRAFREVVLNIWRRGWPVVPVLPREKRPHPELAPRGAYSASKDIRDLLAWFRRCPDLNVGVATGSASGVVGLDVDPRNGGLDSLKRLVERFGKLPWTAHVKTGGGGALLLYAVPEGQRVPSRVLAPGLELKADKTYVVVPPSVHPSGRPYEWLTTPTATPLPTWLIEATVGPAAGGSHELQAVLRRLRELGCSPRREGAQWKARCPAHDDHTPSLAVGAGHSQPVVLYCHAGCDTKAVLEKLGLSWKDVCGSREGAGGGESEEAGGLDLSSFRGAAILKRGIPQVRWVTPGLLAKGRATVLAARPKAGKSTFTRAVVLEGLATGHSLGRPFSARQVAVLTEETEEDWEDVLKALMAHGGEKLANRLLVLPYHTWGRPGVRAILEALAREGVELVIVDSLQTWLCSSLKGDNAENDAAQVARVLEPCVSMARTKGMALLLVHHTDKAQRGPRGSSALSGAVDIVATMRVRGDGARELEIVGRLGVQETLVLRQRDGRYIAEGSSRWTQARGGSGEAATQALSRRAPSTPGSQEGELLGRCPICSRPLSRGRTGRRRRYCSGRCRDAAYRRRRRLGEDGTQSYRRQGRRRRNVSSASIYTQQGVSSESFVGIR